ncbi:PEP-CTERM sorting domain-containing protein [Massilia sp. Mn16-1_5]
MPEPSRILMLALASSLLGAWSCVRARAHAL